MGELGILPNHTPLLTGIAPGPVRLQFEDGEDDVFFASGGFLEIQPGVVTVLADTALHADDIDEAAAQDAKEQAQRAITEHAAHFEISSNDDGPGIPSAVMESMGEPFISMRKESMGLGIFLANGAIQRLGGKIELLNLKLGGALTLIKLPLPDDQQT